MNSTTLLAFQDELQKIAGAPLIPLTEMTPYGYPSTRFIPDPNWSPSVSSAASAAPSTSPSGISRGKLGLGAAVALPVALAGLHALRSRKKKSETQP